MVSSDLYSDCLQPEHIREAMRRYFSSISPMAPFSVCIFKVKTLLSIVAWPICQMIQSRYNTPLALLNRMRNKLLYVHTPVHVVGSEWIILRCSRKWTLIRIHFFLSSRMRRRRLFTVRCVYESYRRFKTYAFVNIDKVYLYVAF